MRIFLWRQAIGATALALIISCAGTTPLQKLPHLPGFAPEPNQYFYFMQAQDARRQGQLDKAILLMKKAIETDGQSLYLRRELATLYLQNKEDERALEVLEGVIEEYPEDVKSLIIYGGIKQVRKENEAARDAYEKVLALDQENDRVFSLLAGLYLSENDFDNAERVLKEMLVYFPDSYTGHYMLGRTYLAEGDAAAAEKQLRKAMALDPARLDPKFELLNLYQQQGDAQAAKRLSEEILSQDPDNIRASLELALYYAKNGMENKSAELLEKLGRRSLNTFEVIVNVVRLYLDPKRYEDAEIVVLGMLKGAPESSELNHLAGITYYGLNENRTAVGYFRKVKPESRFYEDAVVHVAFLLHEEGGTDEAVEFLQDALENDPENAEFNYYLGTMFEELESFEQAQSYLQRAVDADPDNPKYHFRLGVVYDKAGDKEASMASMRRVIELDPEHANALNYLGYTYADLGKNLDEAERLIRLALKYKPEDGYITDSLGWVYYKRGQYDLALTYLKKAVALVPDDPIMLEHLGDVYLKLNDVENALKYYKKALSIKDSDRQALEEKIRNLTEQDQ